MLEIKLQGLNARQQLLADILWSFEEYEQVEAFIATLPDRQACECQSIIEMMRLELVEEYRTGMNINVYPEANMVIDKIKKRS
jgi:hypothetical protein